jgi:hypothetical protein
MNKKKQHSTRTFMRLLDRHALDNVTGGAREQKVPTPDGKDQSLPDGKDQ